MKIISSMLEQALILANQPIDFDTYLIIKFDSKSERSRFDRMINKNGKTIRDELVNSKLLKPGKGHKKKPTLG